MRFFNYINEERIEKIFFVKPSEIRLDGPRELLAYALGATLYMPATRMTIVDDIIKNRKLGLASMVLCMEDAIDDADVQKAEENFFSTFKQLHEALYSGKLESSDIPMIFARIRNAETLRRILERFEELNLLCGFVLPKFSHKNGEEYFSILKEVNSKSNKQFYVMPILESPEIIYRENRVDELVRINDILDRNKEMVLNVRIGATDLCGLYSIRREFDQTVYDIAVIRNCIADIINIFLRAGSGYVVSGPVWEYFSSGSRILKPLLRESAFVSELGREGLQKRTYMINQYLDGLIKETLLDKANGLTGKTVIHPSHVSIVNALQVVTHEEYEDAKMIMEGLQNGAVKSTYNNKMNECKPHLYWAQKVMIKSRIYGVLNENRNYTSLFI